MDYVKFTARELTRPSISAFVISWRIAKLVPLTPTVRPTAVVVVTLTVRRTLHMEFIP
jgi:hypothetical protein